MATKIFVNLPVKDLPNSIAFFTKLGFAFNPQFTDDSATCMIIGENIFVMLLVTQRFKDFTKKEIADATKTTEVLIAIDAESRDKVVELVAMAKAAGGTIYAEPADHGWMYQHSFADLDGHQWEILFMDESNIPKDLHKQEQSAEEPAKISITIESLIDAPIEKVWECWTSAEHIKKWYHASDDWCAPVATNDFKVGGKFLTRMEARDGSAGFDFEGTYTDINLYKKIEYIVGDGRNVTTVFLPQGDQYNVTEIFEMENTNSLEMQKAGWQAILNNFKKYVENF